MSNISSQSALIAAIDDMLSTRRANWKSGQASPGYALLVQARDELAELAITASQFERMNDHAQEAFNRTLIRAEQAEAQLTALHEALHTLITKWRADGKAEQERFAHSASGVGTAMWAVYDGCADELDELAAMRGPQ